MFPIGGIVGAFVCITLLFKLMHWPGGTTLVLISCLLLIAYGLCAYLALKNFEELDAIVSRSGKFGGLFRTSLNTMLLSFSVLGFGVVSRIMHWPGNSTIIMVGMLSLAVGLIYVGYSFPKLKIKQDDK